MTVEPRVGDDCTIDSDVTLGYAYIEGSEPPVIGEGSTIRAGSIVYNDVVTGARLSTGHRVLIRERTELGDDVLVGTNSVIDGRTVVGDAVSMQSGVYVPAESTIGSNVFLGPYAVLTNDPAPIREGSSIDGPTLENDVSVGANATVLPGLTVGTGSFVAAGAVVTEDVPPETLAFGVPARHRPLPESLQGGNQIR